MTSIVPSLSLMQIKALSASEIAGWTTEDVLSVMGANYLLKVGWEVVMTPFTYRIVNFLKRAESEDYFDRKTQFTPFSLQT